MRRSLSGLWRGRKMRCDLALQDRDQLGRHVIVIVRYVQADDALALQVGTEGTRELRPMTALHDEDQIGPPQQFRGDRLDGIPSEPSGCDVDSRMIAEQPLRRGAAKS